MDKGKRNLYFICFLLAACLLFILSREHYPERVMARFSKEKKVYQQYFLGKDKVFEQLPMDSNAIVFIGTSLTEAFELTEFFKGLNLKNRGIAGDGVKGIHNRLDPIIRMNPDKIFFEAGINDLSDMRNDTLLHYYFNICLKLKQNLPETKLYVQSILPVCEGSFRITENIEETNRTIDALNSSISKFAAEKQITYIDVNSSLKKEGKLNPAYSTDGVHLNGLGYKMWAGILEKHLQPGDTIK